MGAPPCWPAARRTVVVSIEEVPQEPAGGESPWSDAGGLSKPVRCVAVQSVDRAASSPNAALPTSAIPRLEAATWAKGKEHCPWHRLNRTGHGEAESRDGAL
jgi:hypothetical protein